MRIDTVEKAAAFVAEYGNVSSSAEELLKTKPTRAQLAEARNVCKSELDVAFHLLETFHYPE